jgi:hypothetical protein
MLLSCTSRCLQTLLNVKLVGISRNQKVKQNSSPIASSRIDGHNWFQTMPKKKEKKFCSYFYATVDVTTNVKLTYDHVQMVWLTFKLRVLENPVSCLA